MMLYSPRTRWRLRFMTHLPSTYEREIHVLKISGVSGDRFGKGIRRDHGHVLTLQPGQTEREHDIVGFWGLRPRAQPIEPRILPQPTGSVRPHPVAPKKVKNSTGNAWKVTKGSLVTMVRVG